MKQIVRSDNHQFGLVFRMVTPGTCCLADERHGEKGQGIFAEPSAKALFHGVGRAY